VAVGVGAAAVGAAAYGAYGNYYAPRCGYPTHLATRNCR
jgi:hypothetical protein